MSKEIVLEVRDDISEKILFSQGFLVFVIIVTSPWNCVTDVII